MRIFKNILLGLIFVLFFSINVWGTNTGGNSGGHDNSGHMGGNGTVKNNSIATDYGIRFSLVSNDRGYEGKIIGRSVDWYRENRNDWKSKNIIHSKDGTTKIEYLNGNKRLNLTDKDYNADMGGYAYHYKDIWKVYGNGRAVKSQKKAWLKQKKHIRALISNMNVTMEQFCNPKNRIVVEPIFYFHFEGDYYALTAHEIALKDKELLKAGKLNIRKKQGSRSHGAVPSADYLQKDKWGIPALPKSYARSGLRYSNDVIMRYMGISIFHPIGESLNEPPKIETFDYVYRCDTEVYTSVNLTMGSDATPDSPLNVSFEIPNNGTINATGIYAPKGYEQLAWVRWRTPKKPADIIINVYSNKGGNNQIKVRIEENLPWEPHNPTATDIKPTDYKEFKPDYNPNESKYCKMPENKSLVWSKWEILDYQPLGDFLYWKEIRHYTTDDDGNRVYSHSSYEDVWDENPYWSFGEHEYTTDTAPDGSSVTYIVNGRAPSYPTYYTAYIVDKYMKLKPAKTCEKANTDERLIKSGYGIEAKVFSNISTNAGGEVTGFQTSKFMFPEFNYSKYWRLGDRTEQKRQAGIYETIELPINYYSYTGYHDIIKARYHFLPVWYPNGSYKVFVKAYDCWTPAGELRFKTTSDIMCKGSLWDDWHIQVVR